jgi:GH25 family lysozyme M1 (1,4-beta-N-acetylmuramidase)
VGHGVDMSNNNNRAPIPDEAQWAIFKVSEATTFTDGDYQGYVTAATDRGLPYGGYHFAHPDVNDPHTEAAYFLHRVAVPSALPAALDIEPRGSGAQHRDPLALMGAQQLGGWINTWCQIVGAATGRAPLLYLNRSYATALIPATEPWPLWLATLDGTIPSTWHGRIVTVCQYAIVGGVDRNVDLVPITTPPPTPTPPPRQDDDMPKGIVHTDTTGREWVFSVGDDHVLRYHVDGEAGWSDLAGLWSTLIAVTEKQPGQLQVTGYGTNPPGQVWRVDDDGTTWGVPYAL